MHHEETGHELIALLLELHEIKTLSPELNKAMRRNHYPYALYHNPAALPEKPRLLITRNNKRNDLKYEKIKQFGSKLSGDSFLQNLIIENDICSKYARLRSKNLLCSCDGACTQFFGDQISYIESLLDGLKNDFDTDFVIITNGRDPLEKGFALIQDGRFRGIGFFPQEEVILSKEEWQSYLTHEFFYPEANGIIKTYSSKNKLQTITL